MKRLAKATFISMALATLASTVVAERADAAGWIVVDPIAGGGHGRVAAIGRPVMPGRPVRPGAPPAVTLHGGVSFGLHLKSESIKVTIKDQIARTYISQTFSNDTDRDLAGMYMFPLPDDTTFSSFSLHIDGKPVEGKILEASVARQQYEEIVRRMVDPGLLEYADYKTVRARIYPIPAHGTKTVELEYTQILKAENGLVKYRFPLKAKNNGDPAEKIDVDVKLSSKLPLRTIWSPTHVVSARRSGSGSAQVAMSETNVSPDKDFLLYYSISDKEMAANLLTHKKKGDDGYFLLTLSPPVKAPAIASKDVVIAADVSGSMSGEKMTELKSALKFIVKALSPSDRFGLVTFNTDAESFKSELVAATPENKAAAEKFIDELDPMGGTNIAEAISTASSLLAGPAAGRPSYLLLMTDGEPTVGEKDPDKLEALTRSRSDRDVRVFDFGIGYDINTRLLTRLAEKHHGTAQFVEPDENLETAISSFYEKIKSPVLSDVKVEYQGVAAKNIYPKEVKDIFAGSQVLLLGRYKDNNATTASVKLTGKLNGQVKSYSFPLKFASADLSNSHLPRLWAMRRIGYLTEVAQSNGETREVVDEIVALSKQYGIISAYTSYLVTDPNEGRRPVQVMSNRPVIRDFRGRETGAAAGGGGARFQFEPNRFAGAPMHSKGASRTMLYKAQLARPAASPVSGRQAVDNARDLIALKSSTTLASPALHRSREESKKDKTADAALNTRDVEDKTFYLENGVWTDSACLDQERDKPVRIVFGSKEYFELLKSKPGIARYLSVGKNLLLSFDGVLYRIVPDASTH